MAHVCPEESLMKEDDTSPPLNIEAPYSPRREKAQRKPRFRLSKTLKECYAENDQLHLSEGDEEPPLPDVRSGSVSSVNMRPNERGDVEMQFLSSSVGTSKDVVPTFRQASSPPYTSPEVQVIKRQNIALCVAVLCLAVIIGVGAGISTGVIGYYYNMKNQREVLSSKNLFVLNSSVSAFHGTWRNVFNDAVGLKRVLKLMGTNFSDPASMRDAYNFTFFLLAFQSVRSSPYVDHLRLHIPFCDSFSYSKPCSKALYLSFECSPHASAGNECFYNTNDDSGENILMHKVIIDESAEAIRGLVYNGSKPMFNLTFHPEIVKSKYGFFLRPSLCTLVDNEPYYYIKYLDQKEIDGLFVDVSAGSYLKNWYKAFDRSLQKASVSYAILFDLSGSILAYSYGNTVTYGVPCCEVQRLHSAQGGAQCGTSAGKVVEKIVSLLVDSINKDKMETRHGENQFSVVLESDEFVVAAQRWFYLGRQEHTEDTVFFVAYATPVVAGLDAANTINVALCVTIVLVSIVILGGITLLSINQLQKTLELVSILAFHVSTYDLDSMEAVLNRTPAGSCFSCSIRGDNFLRQEFARILENLRAYRPFLPQALLTKIRVHGEGASPIPETSVSEDDHFAQESAVVTYAEDAEKENIDAFGAAKLKGVYFNDLPRRLRRARGTILVVELHGSPTEHLDSINLINSFLDIVLTQARASEGVTERMDSRQVVITFNFYSPLLRHQHRACKCALSIQEELIKANIIAFIAIAAGSNYVGTIGTAEQKAHVVSGFSVELAKHLVKLQSILGSRILVTHQVAHESSVATIPVDKVEVFSQRDNAMIELVILEVVAHDATSVDVVHMFAKMIFSSILHCRSEDAIDALRNFIKRYSSLDDVPWFARRLFELCLRNRKMIDGGYKRKGLFWEPLEGEDMLKEYLMVGIKEKIHFFFGYYNPRFRGYDENASFTSGYPIIQTAPVDDVQFAKLKIGEQSQVRQNTLKRKKQGDDALFSLFINEIDEVSDSEVTEAQHRTSLHKLSGGERAFAPREIRDIRGQVYYLTDQLLGKGRFGEVFLGISDSGNFLATKILPFDRNDSELVRELEAISKLRHEHIVTYDTCAINDDRFYLFTEYMAAGNLCLLVNRVGSLPEKIVCKYARDILFGMQYLHQGKYVHCDIKPENIFISCEGMCKLGDFGAVHLTQSVAENAAVLRGTPRFMAPETIFGEYTCQSDIYSFGITVVYMLIGRDPWHAYIESDEEFLVRLTRDRPNMKLHLPENLENKQLENAVHMCCAFNPESRPSVDELLTMLS